jgi:hypothetical protein
MPGDKANALGLDEAERGERRIEHLRGEPDKPVQNIARLRIDKVEPLQCLQSLGLFGAARNISTKVDRFT